MHRLLFGDMMGSKMKVALLIVGGVLAALLLETGDARAIPVFARKYKTSCATCHSAFPMLNPVGEAFRLNGFKFKDDADIRKEEPVEMGSEAYKKVWPDAVWPSDIPGLPPISLRYEG